MKIKICGLKHLDDVEKCCHQGAWALGFNFYSKSPRYISDADAKVLMDRVPRNVLTVGICIGEDYNTLVRRVDVLGLDLIQVYAPINDAPPTFKERVILSLPAASVEDLPKASLLQSYGYVLLDAPTCSDHLLGGTGRLANWALAKTLARDYRLILAGGLNADCAEQAMCTVNPYALDIASGVESIPGKKDHTKINRLFEACIL